MTSPSIGLRRPRRKRRATRLASPLAHFRGTILCHHDHPADSLPCLREALELFGTKHHATAQVLDTLGMAYAALDNFSTARDFYRRAIEYKQRHNDRAGLGVQPRSTGPTRARLGDYARRSSSSAPTSIWRGTTTNTAPP